MDKTNYQEVVKKVIEDLTAEEQNYMKHENLFLTLEQRAIFLNAQVAVNRVYDDEITSFVCNGLAFPLQHNFHPKIKKAVQGTAIFQLALIN